MIQPNPRVRTILIAAVSFFTVTIPFVTAQPDNPSTNPSRTTQSPALPANVFGFRSFDRQARWDTQFLAVPDPALARQHLKTLTSAPHWASSPEDYATALYVSSRFKAAGLETEIVPYSVLLSKPLSIKVDAFDAAGRNIFSGPRPEHVTPTASNPLVDQLQSDPRILPAFNSSSAPADLTAPVVYVNYGRLVDFERLASLGISVRGKIALVRYGAEYRGVKVYIAQQFGAKGVLIYTDPADDPDRGKPQYPDGPDRPASAVQRGSVQFLPIYPGDPTTPGIASVPSLPASKRLPADKLQYDLPSIPSNPLSSADGAPIMRALDGPEAPPDWQGGLGFPYHLGGGAITVHMRLAFDTRLRTIWDVIGKIPGATDPRQLVIAGNHRDAWVYGACDPNSGTAAMLETVHGLGALLKSGWRPARTIILGSWDGEEEGEIGSTEWVEQHPSELKGAVAYFNMDEAAAGPNFVSAAVPSLRNFIRQIAEEVPSADGGTVSQHALKLEELAADTSSTEKSRASAELPVGDLGSGSDYTPFLQHAGVPATDITSDGPFSEYHSTYDNFDWFVRFIDPHFLYTQQMARFFGLEIIHMADSDILPYDYPSYAQSIYSYLEQARDRAARQSLNLNFDPAFAASAQLSTAAQAIHTLQLGQPKDATALNSALIAAERAFLIPQGLPRRPWYRHSIYAPGEFTGYQAVVIPGVNEAIDASDAPRAQSQIDALTKALARAANVLTIR